ncbi:YcxB family protein [Salinimonas sp. HHU 13199]|uniref:YcxB family protein n=1 Tax=Salinimonas profundi TaxID=2729140 RepID=A0ABR8LIM7_9ALTE|nr:YcxB family protein [Salinimonas profundi]MBD3586081.1 YcxB family protein [Salinimonas profundi]
MKVSVDIKKSDIVKLNIWLALKSKGTYSLIALVFAILWVYAIFKHGIPNTTEKWLVTFLIALISGLTAAILGLATNLLQILLSSSVANGVLGLHEYEISDGGLYEKTAVNETKTSWNGIIGIRKLRHYMLIQIAPGLFHVIPDSSFVSEEEFSNFYSASRKFWKDA